MEIVKPDAPVVAAVDINAGIPVQAGGVVISGLGGVGDLNTTPNTRFEDKQLVKGCFPVPAAKNKNPTVGSDFARVGGTRGEGGFF